MRAARVPLALAAPSIVFLLIFYWRGLTVWFQGDDFAWMAQWLEVHDASDLLRSLFMPRAQGSIRPLSERAFFLGLQALFGWDPVPFRAVVFATQAVSLTLVASVMLRVTGSGVAAVLAPLFWAASSPLAVPMMWNSAFNQILCAMCFLAAFRYWLAYCDYGGRRWQAAHWAVFLAGFGVLEIMVMYPLIAASWPPGWKRWKQLAPMFAASVLYTVIQRSLVPSAAEGPYVLYFDASIFTTLADYGRQVFGGTLLAGMPVGPWWQMLGAAAPLLVGLPLAGFLLWRRSPALLVPLAFLSVPLVPMLPLRDHVTHYYLVTPAAGLAMLLAWCCAELALRGVPARVAAVAIAAVFLGTSSIAARRQRDFWYERGEGVRTLVLGVVHARRIHPGKAIVLTGVDSHRFYASIASDALRALDIHDFYLAPDSRLNIDPQPGEPEPARFELPVATLRRALSEDKAVVYAVAGERLRNFTTTYRALHEEEWRSLPALSTRVEPSSEFYAGQLGEGWMASGGGARWIGAAASVFLGAVRGPAKLVIEGYCPKVQFAAGPFELMPRVNGVELGQASIRPPEGLFRLEFPMRNIVPPADRVDVLIKIDHTVPLPDGSHASVMISSIFFEQF